MSDEQGSRNSHIPRSSRAPRLRFNVINNLMWLALMNIVPIGVLMWLGHQYQLGLMGFREGSEPVIGLVILLIIAAVLIIGATWVVLPTLRWAREWSAWQVDNESGSTLIGVLCLPIAWLASLISWLLLFLVAIMVVNSVLARWSAIDKESLSFPSLPSQPSEQPVRQE